MLRIGPQDDAVGFGAGGCWDHLGSYSEVAAWRNSLAWRSARVRRRTGASSGRLFPETSPISERHHRARSATSPANSPAARAGQHVTASAVVPTHEVGLDGVLTEQHRHRIVDMSGRDVPVRVHALQSLNQSLFERVDHHVFQMMPPTRLCKVFIGSSIIGGWEFKASGPDMRGLDFAEERRRASLVSLATSQMGRWRFILISQSGLQISRKLLKSRSVWGRGSRVYLEQNRRSCWARSLEIKCGGNHLCAGWPDHTARTKRDHP